MLRLRSSVYEGSVGGIRELFFARVRAEFINKGLCISRQDVAKLTRQAASRRNNL